MSADLQFDRYYTLYGAEISYFTGKVRPAFLYKRLAFVELLPTPDNYRRVVRARTGLAMIPTVVTPDDETWQDSSDILDHLEARHPNPPLYPRTPRQRVLGHLVELFTDEFFLLAGVHYRWSFTDSTTKALAEFASSNGDANAAGRFASSVQMFTRMAGVNVDTIPVIEANALDVFEMLETHLASQPYLLGGRPSLGDCALMGPLYPHFYIDAVPGRLLRERFPRLCHWIERMNHPDPRDPGEWLADDAIPDTLASLIRLIGQDVVPFVLAQVRAVEVYLDEAPADVDELPRAVGTHENRLRGVTFERITTPYTLWMLQRVQAAFAALDDGGRRAVHGMLAGTGCEALFEYVPRHRVERRPFKLFRAR